MHLHDASTCIPEEAADPPGLKERTGLEHSVPETLRGLESIHFTPVGLTGVAGRRASVFRPEKSCKAWGWRK